MALIDKASLLFVPSVVAQEKAFNILPSGNRAPDSTDQNSGYDQTRADFSFDRGSNAAATRIGSDGLIKKYRENLLVQSNQFDTTWYNSNSTETGGQADKDGGTDAWLLTKTSTNGGIRQNNTTAGVQTFSFYAKAADSNWVKVNNLGSSAYHQANFDLVNGVVGTTGYIIDAKIEDVGNGWFRCITTYNTTLVNIDVRVADSDNVVSGSSGSIYIQNAQLETGLVATDYLDSGATTGKAGVLIDLPRINYDANGENGALLLEPQRSNICPNSEDVSNWYLTFATATANDTTSPEGVKNAAKIVTSSAGCDVKLTSIPVSPSTTYTATFYCKLTSGSGLQTRFYDNTNGANIEYYDYSNQLVIGEWKRVTRTFTTPAGCNNIQIWFLAASSSASVTAHYWGYQLEAGSYPTSYIPNHGESGGVTRAADDMDTTFETPITTDGSATIFFHELGVPDSDDISTTGGAYRYGKDSNNYVSLTTHPSTWRVRVQSGGSSNFQTLSFDYLKTDPIKIAVVVTSTTYSIYANGNTIVENQSMSATADFSSIENIITIIAENVGVRKSKQHIVFGEALSSAECATLTTL